MRKCETCMNRNTGWCKGCEYNFPGVDQFDFYQEIKENGGSGLSPCGEIQREKDIEL